ncbi:MAG: hypothetical protein IJV98_03025 [Clostridia bacterium]|nr:hypothetical protein [Clostridia bacterium]
MLRTESSVILTEFSAENGVANRYRLLQTADSFHGDDVFSIFMTTHTADGTDEEFVYDIAREKAEATGLFQKICRENVCACTLADVTKDLIAER